MACGDQWGCLGSWDWVDWGVGVAMTVAVRVIPCLDVDAGRVVKGVNFRDLRDAGDPVELAAAYDAEGADELVFLDITASSGDRETMLDVVGRTADQVFIPLTVGGGVRSVEDVDRLLRGRRGQGVAEHRGRRPPEVLGRRPAVRSQCVVLSVDARRVHPWGRSPATLSGGLPPEPPAPARAARQRRLGEHPPAAGPASPARFEVTTHGGAPGHRDRRGGSGRPAAELGSARSCSTPWTRTAPRRVST